MMQHRTVRRFAFFALLVLSAAACGDDNDPISTQPPQSAQLRIVNAANVADVQVRRTGATTGPLAQDLDFRTYTATCVSIPAGAQTLVFSSAAGTGDLATTTYTFEGDKRYTAFLVAASATYRAVVLPDNQAAEPNNNAVRFINATTAPGDVYLTPPGALPAPGFRVIGNMGVLATSNDQPAYYSRATTDTRARLYDVGTTDTPRADIPLAGIPPTRLVTVVFTNAPSAGDPTAFIVTPCP